MSVFIARFLASRYGQGKMKNIFNYILFTLITLFVITACEKSADEYYDEGLQFDEKQNYKEALNSFTLAINSRPDFAEAYAFRAGSKYSLGDYDRAFEDANKAIQIDSSLSIAYNNRGIIYLERNQLDNAILDFNQALALDSTFAYAYSNRGIAKTNSKKYTEAIIDHSMAISLDSSKGEFFINRGVCMYFLEDYNTAIQDYNKGIELIPDYKVKSLNFAYLSRGNAYLKAGQKQKALLDFNKSIEVYVKNPSSYYNRGLLFRELGQLDKACDDWKTGSKLGHKDCKELINEYCK